MSDNVKDGTYNEANERQRMLNNLSKNGLRGDDVHGKLAWNIVTQTHELAYKQEDLFAELCSLINKIRNSKR